MADGVLGIAFACTPVTGFEVDAIPPVRSADAYIHTTAAVARMSFHGRCKNFYFIFFIIFQLAVSSSACSTRATATFPLVTQ